MKNEDMLSLSKDEFMRSKIVSSIKDIMLDTPLQKVTVTKICDHANISRSSFYNLFTGVHDAISWEYGRMMGNASSRCSPTNCPDWKHYFTSQLAEILRHELEDARFFRRIGKEMSHIDYDSIFLRTRRRRSQFFRDFIEQRLGDPIDERCAFEIDFFVCAESDTVAKWMLTMEDAPEDVATKIANCIPEYLGKALHNSFINAKKSQETE